MYRQYIRTIDTELISEEDTFLWLLRGDLKGDNQKVRHWKQNYHATKILRTETVGKCIPCQQFDETGEHTSYSK
jgi:hypothetical protein